MLTTETSKPSDPLTEELWGVEEALSRISSRNTQETKTQTLTLDAGAITYDTERGRTVKPFGAWLQEVSPKFKWDWKFTLFIRDLLLQVTTHVILRLMLNLPPRSGKTELVTIRYVAWFIERWPHKRVVIAAYNQFLANKFSRRVRKIVAGRVPLSKERNAVEEWETIYGGGLRVVGVGAGITGQGADLLVIDDPVKSREEAESSAYREKCWEWWTDDLYTRLEPGAQVIVIMTRWHFDDLGGRLQEMEEWLTLWRHVNLPAEAKENDPLGREVGEPLNPDRYTKEDLARIKAVLGRNYSALYQQEPSPPEGTVIKLSWFRRYRTLPAEQPRRILQSWDCASKAKELGSYWVCTTWFEYPHGYYLVDCYRKQVEYPEGKKSLYLEATKWKAEPILIENKASGQALIQEIWYNNNNLATLIPPYNIPIAVIPIEPEGDKIMRASVSSDLIEAGYVYLPYEAEWLHEVENEIRSFPLGATNDIVDSVSQFLRWVGMRIVAAFADLAKDAEKRKELSKHPCACSHREDEHASGESTVCSLCDCQGYKEQAPLWTWKQMQTTLTGKIPIQRRAIPPRRR